MVLLVKLGIELNSWKVHFLSESLNISCSYNLLPVKVSGQLELGGFKVLYWLLICTALDCEVKVLELTLKLIFVESGNMY